MFCLFGISPLHPIPNNMFLSQYCKVLNNVFCPKRQGPAHAHPALHGRPGERARKYCQIIAAIQNGNAAFLSRGSFTRKLSQQTDLYAIFSTTLTISYSIKNIISKIKLVSELLSKLSFWTQGRRVIRAWGLKPPQIKLSRAKNNDTLCTVQCSQYCTRTCTVQYMCIVY